MKPLRLLPGKCPRELAEAGGDGHGIETAGRSRDGHPSRHELNGITVTGCPLP